MGKNNGRGKHWKEEEAALMLSVVSEILPRGAYEWLFVQQKYNEKRLLRAPYFPERDNESIRSKFKVLKNVRKPTGDPTCPINVREAKRIQREIERRFSVANLDAHSGDGQEDDGTMEDQQAPTEPQDDEEYDLDEESQNPDFEQALPRTQPISLPSITSSFRNPASSTSSQSQSGSTPIRTGYTEAELIQLTHSDASLIQLKNQQAAKQDFMQIYFMQEQRRDEERQRREEDRLRREEQREEQRERDRFEQRERDKQFNLTMMALLAKALGLSDK